VVRKCDGFWSETERFHFFFIFEFFSLINPLPLACCLVSSLVVQLFMDTYFFEKTTEKAFTEKRK